MGNPWHVQCDLTPTISCDTKRRQLHAVVMRHFVHSHAAPTMSLPPIRESRDLSQHRLDEPWSARPDNWARVKMGSAPSMWPIHSATLPHVKRLVTLLHLGDPTQLHSLVTKASSPWTLGCSAGVALLRRPRSRARGRIPSPTTQFGVQAHEPRPKAGNIEQPPGHRQIFEKMNHLVLVPKI
jgi:hypothetical protein